MDEEYFSDDDFDEELYYEYIREEEDYQNFCWHAFTESRDLLKEMIQQIEKQQLFGQIEEELIRKTWHPNRFFDWCLSIDEK
jgi:hypothetical protein